MVKSIFRCCILVSLIMLTIGAEMDTQLISWTPEALSNYTLANNHSFIHPEFTFEEAQINRIEEVANKIIVDWKVNLKIFLIKTISKEYADLNDGTFNFNLFFNKLKDLVNKGNENLIDNTLFIFFSVDDQQIRIKTGENVSDSISSHINEELVLTFSSYFNEGNYVEGIVNLLNRIRLNFGSSGWSLSWLGCGLVLAVVFPWLSSLLGSRQSIGLGLAVVLSMLWPLLVCGLGLAVVLAWLWSAGYGLGLAVCLLILLIYLGVWNVILKNQDKNK